MHPPDQGRTADTALADSHQALLIEIDLSVSLLKQTMVVIEGYTPAFIDACPPARKTWNAFVAARTALRSAGNRLGAEALDVLSAADILIDLLGSAATPSLPPARRPRGLPR
jgi:hypothetical protein